MENIKQWMGKALLWLRTAVWFVVPHFSSSEVALRRVGYLSDWMDYEIECFVEDAKPGQVFDAVATADTFEWMWFGMVYRLRDFRYWDEFRPQV